MGERGESICHSSPNVIVYFASDDLALRTSKASNLKNKITSRRLGHTGPEDMRITPANVYTVDCDDVNNIYDNPKRHSYFRSGRKKGQPGLVFEHIFETLLSGRVFPEGNCLPSSLIAPINCIVTAKNDKKKPRLSFVCLAFLAVICFLPSISLCSLYAD